MRRAAYILGFLLAIGGIAVAGRGLLLRGAGHLLVRDDDPQAAVPYIVLLMGDSSTTRADKAIEIYHRHPGQKIIFAKEKPYGFQAAGLVKNGTEAHADYLAMRGIPARDIVVLRDCIANSTRDEAQCVRGYFLKSTPPVRIAVVTSWFHTARAGWLFDQELGSNGIEIQMVPAAATDEPLDEWWHNKGMFLAVFDEYLKWAYWLGLRSLSAF